MPFHQSSLYTSAFRDLDISLHQREGFGGKKPTSWKASLKKKKKKGKGELSYIYQRIEPNPSVSHSTPLPLLWFLLNFHRNLLILPLGLILEVIPIIYPPQKRSKALELSFSL